MRPFLKDSEHLIRVAGLFLAGVLLFLVLQALLVPEGFGVYGHFRSGALADNRERALSFAGHATCDECHSDVADARKGGKHAAVACEACHGPLARHAEDPGTAKAVRPDARKLCLVCHSVNVAKPARFPQVEPREHSGGKSCLTCHTAHNPGLAPEAKP